MKAQGITHIKSNKIGKNECNMFTDVNERSSYWTSKESLAICLPYHYANKYIILIT